MKKLFITFTLIMMITVLTACSGKKNPTAIMETTLGTITLEIFTNEIPELSKNFMELSKAGKYDSVPFHRVIKNFMIQGGDFENKNGTGGYSYKGPGTELPGEFAKGISNVRGTISMANRGPNTNGSQFFINVVDNTYLDFDGSPNDPTQHPVFGKVIDGMDVIDAISKVETVNDAPKEAVVIKKITIK